MIFMSIDPGTVTCGVAVWKIDDDYKIKDLYSFTIVIDSKIDMEERLDILRSKLKDYFNELKPYHLAHESAFINRLRPQAYGPIYASIYLLRTEFKKYKNIQSVYAYPPKSVKAKIIDGRADKFDMLEAISNISELSVWLSNEETEHEIDAIAIGYIHLLNIRDMPELLLL